MRAEDPILVIGAGISGLACARTIAARGRDVLVLERSERVGGRLGSIVVDGIVCDLGFQVSMSNYTALESLVSMQDAPRRDFESGAIVVTDRRRACILDPARRPLASTVPLLSGFVKPRDLLAAIRLRTDARKIDQGGHQPGLAADYLDHIRFSPAFRSGFIDPFFSGVMLDQTLAVPADRFLRTVHRFATGRAQLPDGGMQSIADAMAAPVKNRIEFGVEVSAVDMRTVRLADGGTIHGSKIVLATPVDVTRQLLGLAPLAPDRTWSSTSAVHFKTTAAVPTEPLIILDGREESPLNLTCVPTAIADGYAPDGVSTVLASLRPSRGTAPPHDLDRIRVAAAELLEVHPADLEHVATTDVSAALPRPDLPSLDDSIPTDVILAGDHLTDPSIEAAVTSGIQAAESALAA